MKFSAAVILMLAVLSADDAFAAEKTLKVKAVVDKEYKEYFLFRGDWEEHVRTYFEVAARQFSGQFGGKIVLVEIAEWRSPRLSSLPDLLVDLRSRFWGVGVDFIIGFTGKAADYNGAAFQNHYFAAISTVAAWGTPYTLLHEIGHLCGADHVGGPSVMSDDIMLMHKTFDFDAANAEKIRNGQCLK